MLARRESTACRIVALFHELNRRGSSNYDRFGPDHDDFAVALVKRALGIALAFDALFTSRRYTLRRLVFHLGICLYSSRHCRFRPRLRGLALCRRIVRALGPVAFSEPMEKTSR
jgi:hypothetical protein